MWSGFYRFVLKFLDFFLHKRGHFSSIPALRPLPAVTIRRYRPADFDACVEIYALNEPGRFPRDRVQIFKEFIQAPSQFTFVAEEAGKVLGCGSLIYSDGYMEGGIAILVFGLVHPEHQKRGIGTVLLLARLAQLRILTDNCPVLIFSVPASFRYFLRFGFVYIGNWLTENAITYPAGRVFMTTRSIKRCGRILAKAGISFPYEPDLVPHRKAPESVKPAEQN